MREWGPPERLEQWDDDMVRERLRLGESDFTGCAFSDIAFDGMDFYGVSFSECRFTRCRFPGAEMGTCSFVDVEMEACDLSGTALEESFWQRCTISNCRLVGAGFRQARLRQVRCKECAAGYVCFDQARFDRVFWRTATFLRRICAPAGVRRFRLRGAGFCM